MSDAVAVGITDGWSPEQLEALARWRLGVEHPTPEQIRRAADEENEAFAAPARIGALLAELAKPSDADLLVIATEADASIIDHCRSAVAMGLDYQHAARTVPEAQLAAVTVARKRGLLPKA